MAVLEFGLPQVRRLQVPSKFPTVIRFGEEKVRYNVLGRPEPLEAFMLALKYGRWPLYGSIGPFQNAGL